MPWWIRVLYAPALLALSSGWAAAANAKPTAACGSLNAGFRIITNIPSPAGGSSYAGGLKMAVWYPTDAAAAAYQYPGPGGAMSGLVALNAPAASSPWRSSLTDGPDVVASGPIALAGTVRGVKHVTYLVALGTGMRGSADAVATAAVGSALFDGVHGPRPVIARSQQ